MKSKVLRTRSDTSDGCNSTVKGGLLWFSTASVKLDKQILGRQKDRKTARQRNSIEKNYHGNKYLKSKSDPWNSAERDMLLTYQGVPQQIYDKQRSMTSAAEEGIHKKPNPISVP